MNFGTERSGAEQAEQLEAALGAALEQARADLLNERASAGHWIGELSTSALSTATAISALSLVLHNGTFADAERSVLQPRIDQGIRWLSSQANPDGGFGDTDKSHSNIATTWLSIAALHLAGRGSEFPTLMERANAYVDRKGRVEGLRARYGKDKTFAVPILTNAALAGLVPWKVVSALPFELACLPQEWYHLARLPVVSYAVPALVAIGQAKYHFDPPRNPIMRWIRRRAIDRSLRVLASMQPASGGYLEAVPLTSFVLMSLAATGRATHPVARQAVQFLLQSVRDDGSWPIDTNLATWNTTLALNALEAGDFDVTQLGPNVLDWLLNCQFRSRHPFTGAAPGGWGWSDLSGAVPDADDTPGAILALAAWGRRVAEDRTTPSRINAASGGAIGAAIGAGIPWLLQLQNRDGGWPTFCRGWGKLPFDRSGADITAHVLRALRAGRPFLEAPGSHGHSTDGATRQRTARQIDAASAKGIDFLRRQQQPNGSWIPLWFGNQFDPREENPVYGTAKVVLAFAELGRANDQSARRGVDWLLGAQNADGGWGIAASPDSQPPRLSSVEETALAVEALAAMPFQPEVDPPLRKGLDWLIRSVETRRHIVPAPIGFYFAKLWYYERLYPLEFTVSALGRGWKRIREQARMRKGPNP
ncbi:MAG: squalene--hopene cyclase [Planctomycetes bacterium]|nr:squalene--hopene cyclase [Planctomycetota bacterium]